MGVLDRLSPGQKQVLVVGGPAVAALALIRVIQNRGASTTVQAPATGSILATQAPTTDAIGVGELSSFESLVTGAITQLSTQVAKLPTDIPAPNITVAPSKINPVGVKSNWYPTIAPQGEDMVVLGTITGSGYRGVNVGGGAPVYANIGGQWRQNFGSDLPAGTLLATTGAFRDYIDPNNVTGDQAA